MLPYARATTDHVALHWPLRMYPMSDRSVRSYGRACVCVRARVHVRACGRGAHAAKHLASRSASSLSTRSHTLRASCIAHLHCVRAGPSAHPAHWAQPCLTQNGTAYSARTPHSRAPRGLLRRTRRWYAARASGSGPKPRPAPPRRPRCVPGASTGASTGAPPPSPPAVHATRGGSSNSNSGTAPPMHRRRGPAATGDIPLQFVVVTVPHCHGPCHVDQNQKQGSQLGKSTPLLSQAHTRRQGRVAGAAPAAGLWQRRPAPRAARACGIQDAAPTCSDGHGEQGVRDAGAERDPRPLRAMPVIARLLASTAPAPARMYLCLQCTHAGWNSKVRRGVCVCPGRRRRAPGAPPPRRARGRLRSA